LEFSSETERNSNEEPLSTGALNEEGGLLIEGGKLLEKGAGGIPNPVEAGVCMMLAGGGVLFFRLITRLGFFDFLKGLVDVRRFFGVEEDFFGSLMVSSTESSISLSILINFFFVWCFFFKNLKEAFPIFHLIHCHKSLFHPL